MIDIAELIKRHQLRDIITRINHKDHLIDITEGTYRPQNGDILPKFEAGARYEAWLRAHQTITTIGPELLERKLNFILGDINWGGNDNELDEALQDIDLRAYAMRLLRPDYLTVGIMAGYAYLDKNRNNKPRITRLGGYVEPYTADDDMDEIVGLFQAQQVTREKTIDANAGSNNQNSSFNTGTTRAQNKARLYKWNVRIYDWSDSTDERTCTMREWQNLDEPYQLGAPPNETPDHPRPRYRIRQMTQYGLPQGELESGIGTIIDILRVDLMETLGSEFVGIPMLKLFGGIDVDNLVIGGGKPIVGPAEAAAEWLEGFDLEGLRERRNELMERARQKFSLTGGFLGNDSPSGEALKEANLAARQNATAYARDTEGILTELVDDLANLLGVNAPAVSVAPSEMVDPSDVIRDAIALQDAGLADLPPLAEAVSSHVPWLRHWSDKAREAWVEERTARISVADFDLEVGATNEQPEDDDD